MALRQLTTFIGSYPELRIKAPESDLLKTNLLVEGYSINDRQIFDLNQVQLRESVHPLQKKNGGSFSHRFILRSIFYCDRGQTVG